MASYLLDQMMASCFITTLMKSKLLPAVTNALVEMELRFTILYTNWNVEFASFVYASDSSTGSIKLIAPLKRIFGCLT